MSRADEFNRSTEKPAEKYIWWSSDNKCFVYWDGEAKEEVQIGLPLKFIVLMERHTIKGFHDDSNSRIYSNEVEDITKDELTVKSFEGGQIAKGQYGNIKDTVQKAGGHYAKSIYILTDDGKIWNVSLKGSAVFAWGEFTKKDKTQLITHSVSCTDATEEKKGKIEYSVPVFEYGKKIPKKAVEAADAAYDQLIESLSARAQSLAKQATKDSEEEEEDEIETEEEEDHEMPDPAKIDF